MKSHSIQSELERDLASHGGMLSEAGIRRLLLADDAVLLESSRPVSSGDETFVFVEPLETIRAMRVHEVVPALVRAQVYLEQGMYVAGYISYEAGAAFLPVPVRDPSDDPPYLLWFGVYKRAVRVRRAKNDMSIPASSDRFTVGQVEPAILKKDYVKGMETIRRYLEAGNTYQVNFTFPVQGRWSGETSDLYARLRANQPVSYGSIVVHDGCTMLSFSPELFFRIRKNVITLKPMKGTAPRGKTLEEEETNREWLLASEKDRAENRMIVDLLRNDVGRIAKPGTVSVRSFYDIETYVSVLQATSTIEARLREGTALVDVLRALFPSGSVTGAPKIETMRIIHEVEPEPRGVYTGAIGYAGPDGETEFSVAIRTLIADERSGRFRLNVGSGVTIASDTEREYQECLQKAAFVSREDPTFELFETILWTRGKGFMRLPDHVRRMKRSAGYFGWPFDEKRMRACLKEHTSRHMDRSSHPAQRVRLRMDRSGRYAAESRPLDPSGGPVRIGLSTRTISSGDRFQYHKTTHRQVYDIVLEEAEARGWFDALVFNERGELAEGARSNIFIEKNGVLYTPPVSAGILAGTMRSRVLNSSGRIVEERTLYRKDLLEADRIFLSNALRGLMEAELA